MKFGFIFVFILLMNSCASKPKVDSKKYLDLHKIHAPKHKVCIEFRNKVLIPPITDFEDAPRDDENYLFVRTEKVALKYIDGFDISKFTLKENLLEYQAMVEGCVNKTDPSHVTCDTLMPGYKFFRGLIYGMTQYNWSQSTMDKSLAITLSYINYLADAEDSLMEILLANDLLKRLAEKKFIDKAIISESIKIRHTGEKLFQDLKDQITKMGKKDITCDKAAGFYTKERVKVRELAKDFKHLLHSVKSNDKP
jgi:hypothetical protein